MCLTETNMKKGTEQTVILPNFKLAAAFSREKCRGGSCILVDKNIEFNVLDKVTNKFSVVNKFECCGIEITQHNLIIICIYRIPKNTRSNIDFFLNRLEGLLNILTNKQKKKELYFVGIGT